MSPCKKRFNWFISIIAAILFKLSFFCFKNIVVLFSQNMCFELYMRSKIMLKLKHRFLFIPEIKLSGPLFNFNYWFILVIHILPVAFLDNSAVATFGVLIFMEKKGDISPHMDIKLIKSGLTFYNCYILNLIFKLQYWFC